MFTPPPVAFDVYESDDSDSGDHDDAMDKKANQVEKKLKMNSDGPDEKKESSDRWVLDKYGRICLFARPIYEKRICILKYYVFMENLFSYFWKIVC